MRIYAASWISALSLGAALCASLGASPALAQTPLPPRNDIRVQVNTSLSQPVSPSQANALADLETNARKTIYELAGNECKLLLATIAAECRLESLNVNSNMQNQYYRGDTSNMVLMTSSNAAFKIRLKD